MTEFTALQKSLSTNVTQSAEPIDSRMEDLRNINSTLAIVGYILAFNEDKFEPADLKIIEDGFHDMLAKVKAFRKAMDNDFINMFA